METGLKHSDAFDFAEFTVFENTRGWAGTRLAKRFKDVPFVTIGKIRSAISVLAQKKLSVRKGDQVVFANREGKIYMAVLPMDARIKGYIVTNLANTGVLYVNVKSATVRGLEKGVYEIIEPVYVKGIDWFELYPLEITNENE